MRACNPFLSLRERHGGSPQFRNTGIPSAKSSIELRLGLFQLKFRLLYEGVGHYTVLSDASDSALPGFPIIHAEQRLSFGLGAVKEAGQHCANHEPLEIVEVLSNFSSRWRGAHTELPSVGENRGCPFAVRSFTQ